MLSVRTCRFTAEGARTPLKVSVGKKNMMQVMCEDNEDGSSGENHLEGLSLVIKY